MPDRCPVVWCAGDHKPLYHCLGEPEPLRCFREIGRTPGGEGQVIVGLTAEVDDDHPYLVVLHTEDTGSDVEELKVGDIFLVPDYSATFVDLVVRGHIALLDATRKADEAAREADDA